MRWCGTVKAKIESSLGRRRVVTVHTQHVIHASTRSSVGFAFMLGLRARTTPTVVILISPIPFPLLKPSKRQQGTRLATKLHIPSTSRDVLHLSTHLYVRVHTAQHHDTLTQIAGWSAARAVEGVVVVVLDDALRSGGAGCC